MTVIIPHSTEELHLINFQKEIITELFTKSRILYSNYPLWIDINNFELTEKKRIKSICLGQAEITADGKEIYIPVFIEGDELKTKSKLTLVSIFGDNIFSDSDYAVIRKKKQPVNQLKIFRLGLVQEEGLHAKSISKSVWCKLK